MTEAMTEAGASLVDEQQELSRLKEENGLLKKELHFFHLQVLSVAPCNGPAQETLRLREENTRFKQELVQVKRSMVPQYVNDDEPLTGVPWTKSDEAMTPRTRHMDASYKAYRADWLAKKLVPGRFYLYFGGACIAEGNSEAEIRSSKVYQDTVRNRYTMLMVEAGNHRKWLNMIDL